MIHYATVDIAPTSITPMPSRDDYLSASDAAKHLRVSRATFYRMLDDGRLTGIRTYKPGPRLTLYHRQDLEDWIKKQSSVVGGQP